MPSEFVSHQLDITLRDKRSGEVSDHTVRIDIDIKGILAKLGPRAVGNKTGRAIEIGGLLVVKVVKPR